VSEARNAMLQDGKGGQDPERTGIRLDVPYISQFDLTAMGHSADCGPACVAMILNAGKRVTDHITVDELYARHLPHKGMAAFTSMAELAEISRAEGVPVQVIRYSSASEALDALRKSVRGHTPLIVMANDGQWDDLTGNHATGGHFVLVTGLDKERILVHDPSFHGARRNEGAFFALPEQRFLDGWGSCHENGNPDFQALVPQKQVARLQGTYDPNRTQSSLLSRRLSGLP
jgi:predicted double-glycine peptidase